MIVWMGHPCSWDTFLFLNVLMKIRHQLYILAVSCMIKCKEILCFLQFFYKIHVAMIGTFSICNWTGLDLLKFKNVSSKLFTLLKCTLYSAEKEGKKEFKFTLISNLKNLQSSKLKHFCIKYEDFYVISPFWTNQITCKHLS